MHSVETLQFERERDYRVSCSTDFVAEDLRMAVHLRSLALRYLPSLQADVAELFHSLSEARSGC